MRSMFTLFVFLPMQSSPQYTSVTHLLRHPLQAFEIWLIRRRDTLPFAVCGSSRARRDGPGAGVDAVEVDAGEAIGEWEKC